MELNEWLTMRRNQKSWVGPQVTACALLSLYRMEGWTDKAMGNLYKEFETIKQDFNYDPDNLKKASLEETGFQFVDEHFMVPRRIAND